MKNFTSIFTLFFLFNGLANAAITKEILFSDEDQCLSTREYITTFHFLKKNKDFGLSQEEIHLTGMKVSQGCTGSSQRFINVLKVLTKMGIDTRSSIDYALNFTDKTDDYTQVFVEVFRRSYDPKYLNLDALTSLKMSLRLSKDYKGILKNSESDFKNLVEFCLKEEILKLSNPSCGQLSAKIAALGESFQDPLAKYYIEIVKFLQEDKAGPKLDKNQTLKYAENIIANGPQAVENFIQAYKFATNKKKLAYTDKQALAFSFSLAQNSLPKTLNEISDQSKSPAQK